MKYVAEMTINHLGMKNILKKMISSAHDAGSTIVKLKLKNVDNYYSEDGKKMEKF
jgi:sialic acid synthase SpsE